MRVKQQVGIAFLAALSIHSSGWAKDHSFPTQEDEAQLMVSDCISLLGKGGPGHAFQVVKALVQSQGMRLVPQACPFVRVAEGEMRQVLDVRVLITDSGAASDFVRGPLADGEEVDMGTVDLEASSTEPARTAHSGSPEEPSDDTAQEAVSPDMEFNRQWLKNVMKSRGWDAVPGHWWAFVPGATIQ